MTTTNVNTQEEFDSTEVIERAMRIFIAGRNNSTGRVFMNMDSKNIKYTEYEAVVDESQKGSTGINALAVMNRALEQIKDLKEEGTMFSEPVVIYNIGMVSDPINRGTFKYWLNTGKRNSGEEITELEMNLWAQFAELYQELFLDIIIKNISSASLPKNIRYKTTSQQRMDANIVAQLWDKLPKVTDVRLQESESDDVNVAF